MITDDSIRRVYSHDDFENTPACVWNSSFRFEASDMDTEIKVFFFKCEQFYFYSVPTNKGYVNLNMYTYS